MVYRQHWLSPHPSSQQPHPELQLAGMLCRRTCLSRGGHVVAPRQLQVRVAETMGSGQSANGELRRSSRPTRRLTPSPPSQQWTGRYSARSSEPRAWKSLLEHVVVKIVVAVQDQRRASFVAIDKYIRDKLPF